MTSPAERLRNLRAATERRRAQLGAEISELRTDRSFAGPADDEHDPEGVTLSSEWSRLEGLHAAATSELLDVDAALVRLEEGSYGVCIECGHEIPAARLEARPAATRCVACSARVGR